MLTPSQHAPNVPEPEPPTEVYLIAGTYTDVPFPALISQFIRLILAFIIASILASVVVGVVLFFLFIALVIVGLRLADF